MELSHETEGFEIPVAILSVKGRVDSSNYLQLIDKARDLVDNGAQSLVLDLGGCHFMSSSGLFALHNIALLVHRVPELDPEQGWTSLRAMRNDDHPLKSHFKIANVQPNIHRSLDLAGFLPLFDIYPDTRAALEAFKAER